MEVYLPEEILLQCFSFTICSNGLNYIVDIEYKSDDKDKDNDNIFPKLENPYEGAVTLFSLERVCKQWREILHSKSFYSPLWYIVYLSLPSGWRDRSISYRCGYSVSMGINKNTKVSKLREEVLGYFEREKEKVVSKKRKDHNDPDTAKIIEKWNCITNEDGEEEHIIDLSKGNIVRLVEYHDIYNICPITVVFYGPSQCGKSWAILRQSEGGGPIRETTELGEYCGDSDGRCDYVFRKSADVCTCPFQYTLKQSKGKDITGSIPITLLDIAGSYDHKCFRAIQLGHDDTINVIVMVFSLINPDTLQMVEKEFFKELKDSKCCKKPIILAGCKLDLRDKPLDALKLSPKKYDVKPISTQEALEVAHRIGAVAYIEFSNTTGTNFTSLMNEIVVASVKKVKKGKKQTMKQKSNRDKCNLM